MAASQVEKAPAEIKAVSQEGVEKWLHFPPLIAAIERDIRLNLHPPFSRKIASNLSSIIRLVLDHIVEDLANVPADLKRPVTGPVELELLQEEGEEILDAIEPYVALADHYENDQVVQERFKRRTDEVSKELDELSNRTRVLKRRIVKYLKDVNKCIGDSGI
jgi:hypothetical protein